MGKKFLQFLALLITVITFVVPVAAEEARVDNNPADIEGQSLEQREQRFPETAAMLDKIAQIIKGGDLRDTAYLEKLFNTHFLKPFCYGNSSLTDVLRRDTDGPPGVVTPLTRTEQPAYTLKHDVSIQGMKDPGSCPSSPASDNATLMIEINPTHICLRPADFQPLFDAEPSRINTIDERYEKSDGVSSWVLHVVESYKMHFKMEDSLVHRGGCEVGEIFINVHRQGASPIGG